MIQFIVNDWENFVKDDPELIQFYNRRNFLSISNDIVLFSDRVVIPKTLQKRILHQLHQGHPGIFKMKNLARTVVYWPNIDQQIETFVKKCSKCALAGKSPVKTLLHSWPTPTKPWERIHIDYASTKNTNFLVVVDGFSKWPEIVRTSSTTSSKTINILSSIFARFGAPEIIVSDNGPQFISEQFQTFCNLNGIEHIQTSPYNPMSNGQAERFVDTFKRTIKKLEGSGNSDENLMFS